jgi:protein-S-isoprenylcysteine O-methyltransferase Ste14
MTVLSLAFASWAMIENAFFSTAVRIQTDRGQTVCQTGPYRFVRHPGYVGFILQSLATPILLGSIWALLPGMAAGIALVVRTGFEDRALQVELPGYREYAQQIRFRLLPGFW